MWLKEEDFRDILQTWWQGLIFRGSASFVLGAKLKALKPLLKNGNMASFGNIAIQKDKALKFLNH